MANKNGLVLSRREGEKISIGGEITLSVVEIKGNRVVVQIDAPRNLKILRTELKINEDQQG
jgi:carbon storage regulator